MSQNDFIIANQSASSARADINNALQALASLSSGNSAPSTTYANMLWYETDTNLLRMRDEANAAWITLGYLNQSSDEFSIIENTKLVNTSGTTTGNLGATLLADWRAGTSATESLISPARLANAVITQKNIDPGSSTYYNKHFDLTAGLQVRFGFVNMTSETQTNTFSTAFTNDALSIVVQRKGSSSDKTILVDNLTRTNFRTDADGFTSPFWYIALGH